MKKIASLVLISVLVFALASCAVTKIDPVDLAKTLDDNDYYVEYIIDDSAIESFADEAELRSKDIHSCIIVEPEEDDEEKGGLFIICNDKKNTDDVLDDLEEFLERELEDTFVRAVVEKVNKTTIYIGCEDVLDFIK